MKIYKDENVTFCLQENQVDAIMIFFVLNIRDMYVLYISTKGKH